MRGSLASPKREQSCVYCTMSSLWAFQNWESCPRSRSDFRRERCRVRVTLQSTGLHHCMGTGLGMLQSLRLCTHPKHLPVLMQPSAASSPPVWEIAALPPPGKPPAPCDPLYLFKPLHGARQSTARRRRRRRRRLCMAAVQGCTARWFLYQQVHPRPALSAITPLSVSTLGFGCGNESLGTSRSGQSAGLLGRTRGWATWGCTWGG